jgi:hypothetical protein
MQGGREGALRPFLVILDAAQIPGRVLRVVCFIVVDHVVRLARATHACVVICACATVGTGNTVVVCPTLLLCVTTELAIVVGIGIADPVAKSSNKAFSGIDAVGAATLSITNIRRASQVVTATVGDPKACACLACISFRACISVRAFLSVVRRPGSLCEIRRAYFARIGRVGAAAIEALTGDKASSFRRIAASAISVADVHGAPFSIIAGLVRSTAASARRTLIIKGAGLSIVTIDTRKRIRPCDVGFRRLALLACIRRRKLTLSPTQTVHRAVSVDDGMLAETISVALIAGAVEAVVANVSGPEALPVSACVFFSAGIAVVTVSTLEARPASCILSWVACKTWIHGVGVSPGKTCALDEAETLIGRVQTSSIRGACVDCACKTVVACALIEYTVAIIIESIARFLSRNGCAAYTGFSVAADHQSVTASPFVRFRAGAVGEFVGCSVAIIINPVTDFRAGCHRGTCGKSVCRAGTFTFTKSVLIFDAARCGQIEVHPGVTAFA